MKLNVAIGDKSIPAGAKRRNPNITKPLVVIAVEMLEPKGFGRIRLHRITDASERQTSLVACEKHIIATFYIAIRDV